MCGIFGFSTRAGVHDTDRILHRMQGVLRHRGPDDSGLYRDDAMALGSVLLSIVDVGHGRQPFARACGDRRVIGVYNGEVYNHRELKARLEDECGCSFETRCDTEVAIAAWAAWGPSALTCFDGQWALAIWDPLTHRLSLARDPFGIKPLYYRAAAGTIVFASEPKALFLHPDVSKAPNREAMAEYWLHGLAFASGYSSSHRSFYAGVEQLPPGHWLEWSPRGAPVIRRYFELPLDQDLRPDAEHETVLHVRQAVTESVRGCLMGDVRVGTALSGGLDSSIITAAAAHEARAHGASPLLACCIRYQQQAENPDEFHARLLADHLHADAPCRLEYSELSPDDYLDDVDELITAFDEPHWEPKQLAMFRNYRRLAQLGARVVLTGEGADELFFGYYHRFPGFLHPVVESVDMLRASWAKRLPIARQMLAPGAAAPLDTLLDSALERFFAPYVTQGVPPARAMQAWYLHTFLHWLLLDNDRCSMWHRLEGRFPFLTRDVFTLALRIPVNWQVGREHGEEKLMLRRAFADLLPAAIAQRAKQPLPSPMALPFHAAIADGCARALREVDESFWEVISRDGAMHLLARFREALTSCAGTGSGADLTRYLALNERWDVRTPQVFALMTMARWWTLNFGNQAGTTYAASVRDRAHLA